MSRVTIDIYKVQGQSWDRQRWFHRLHKAIDWAVTGMPEEQRDVIDRGALDTMLSNAKYNEEVNLNGVRILKLQAH